MIVVLDTRALVRWAVADPDDPDKARLDNLLAKVTAARGRVVIPTPVLAEFLVGSDETTEAWLAGTERKATVQIAPFDRKAALECALIDSRALKSGDKRGGRKDAWQAIKVDRQIVAIARAVNANVIITDDAGLSSTARSMGIEAKSLSDLELPEHAKQRKLDLVPDK